MSVISNPVCAFQFLSFPESNEKGHIPKYDNTVTHGPTSSFIVSPLPGNLHIGLYFLFPVAILPCSFSVNFSNLTGDNNGLPFGEDTFTFESSTPKKIREVESKSSSTLNDTHEDRGQTCSSNKVGIRNEKNKKGKGDIYDSLTFFCAFFK